MFFGIKGPKEILATSIAEALAEFFEVDASMIESNLLNDSKIILNWVRLRPQTYEAIRQPLHNAKKAVVMATSTGVVEQVIFTWTWALGSTNSDGVGSWVNDATLTLRGLNFKTQLSYGIYSDETKTVTPIPQGRKKSQKLEKIKKEGKLEAYIRNQVEQIIDAFTLNLTDFEFTLGLPPSADGRKSEITIGGQSVELLRSLGRLWDSQVGGKGTLQQQLSLGELYINILESTVNQEKQTFPLMSPISYRAILTRRSGPRFTSFGSGLEVVGQPMVPEEGEDSGIIFHMGSAQIAVLSRLGKLLMAAESLQSVECTSEKMKIEFKELIDDNFEALKKEILTSSIFQFAFSDISLVLPNETKCTLERFVFEFQADGTVMTMVGAEGAGILVNDFPFAVTNDGTTGFAKSRWLVDFVSSTFSIKHVESDELYKTDGMTTRVAFIQLHEDVMENMMSGTTQMFEAARGFDFSSKNEDSKKTMSPNIWEWSIEIEKRVDLRLEKRSDDVDKEKETIYMTIENLSVDVPIGPSSKIKCERIMIEPYSQGEFSVNIPYFHRQLEEEMACFNGDISVQVESFTVATQIYTFKRSFTELIFGNSNEFDEFLIPSAIPNIKVFAAKENAKLELDGVRVGKSTIDVNVVRLNNASGSALMSGVRAIVSPNLHLDVEVVKNIIMPGSFSLSQPLANSSLHFEGDSLSIKLTALDGLLLLPKPGIEQKGESTWGVSNSPICLPFPVSVSIEEVNLEKQIKIKKKDKALMSKKKKQEAFLHLRKLEASAKPLTIESSDESQCENIGDIEVTIRLREAQNTMIQILKSNISGLINLMCHDEIRDFTFATSKPIQIRAGDTTVDWAQMFESNEEDVEKGEPIRLPNAYISTLKLEISANFSVIAQKPTILDVSAFQGDSETTSNDLVEYFSVKVLKKVPGMIPNTEVLGANLIGLSGAAMGFGAVLGLVVCVGADGVQNSLDAGKKSRSADSYKPGDFFRGIGYTVTQTTKEAGEKRRAKHDGKGADDHLGDFAVGAAHGTVGYVDNNKVKLGGATAAGVGCVVGTMFGGPLCGIVGGIVLGAGTAKTIELLDKEFGKRKSSDDESSGT